MLVLSHKQGPAPAQKHAPLEHEERFFLTGNSTKKVPQNEQDEERQI